MAKVKNKRNSGLADKVRNKKKAELHKKKLNPFEVHINREKIKVLGQKSKHDRGLPGVSRAKAMQKRKETLGTEMKIMNKTNAFIDRRIGEKNGQLSAEDKIIARFAAERAKQHMKKNIYNLADDEILTHRGQTLEQIEKFDDPRSSDDEDDGEKKFGGLDDEFVSEGHFGGGVLSKTDSKDGAKSHKDLIEQLIAESKKRKAEKQREKEQTLDLTEKLDSEWKDLQPVVLKRARTDDGLSNLGQDKGQDYDKMMQELRFEKRGTPSDGLKSEELKEKEEKQRLEQLEKEREQRMWGDDDNVKVTKTTSKHRSAEDLDDNFELDNEHDFMLAYDKDGNPLVPDHIFKANSVPNSKKKFEDGVSDSSSDDNEGDDDDDDEESDESADEKVNRDNREKMGNDKEEKGDDDDASQSSDSDKDELQASSNKKSNIDKKTKDPSNKNFINENTASVLLESETSKESDDDDDENDETKESSDIDESDDESNKDQSDNSNNFSDLKDLKESDESSDDEDLIDETEKISSFFDMKSNDDVNLKELLEGKSPAQQSAILQKFIKSYDPSLAETNKDLLTRLYAHLLQYIHDIFSNLKEESDIIKSFLILDKVAPHLYDLSQTNKVSTKKCLVEVLKEKHEEFVKNKKIVPNLNTLIFFKLVSLIYPTSDFKHPVTSPSLVFMTEILTLSRFRNVYSVTRGLFITSLILEYIVLSKRFVPSALNYLRGILYLTANTSILNPIQIVPPFRLHKDIKFLNLEEDCSKMSVESNMAAKDLVLNEASNEFKIRCLSTAVDMLKEFFDNYIDLEALECIFAPHIKLLSMIDLGLYPKKISNKVSETLKYMKQTLEVKTYTPLTSEKKIVKALRMYEPDVQEVFTGNKCSKLSREEVERRKLKHKYKKEMKGALREIRRDKAYIASVKIKQKIQSDNIRKDKVKQIYKDASIQQGELNQLKRKK